MTKRIKQKNIGNIRTYKNHEWGFTSSKHCKREDKCMISSSLECETTLRIVGTKDMVNRMKVLQEKKPCAYKLVMMGIFILLIIVHETFSCPWMLILKLYTNLDLNQKFNLSEYSIWGFCLFVFHPFWWWAGSVHLSTHDCLAMCVWWIVFSSFWPPNFCNNKWKHITLSIKCYHNAIFARLQDLWLAMQLNKSD